MKVIMKQDIKENKCELKNEKTLRKKYDLKNEKIVLPEGTN